MAAPELRVVRRRKGALTASVTPPGNALVAASSVVDNPRDVFRSCSIGTPRHWQDECWELMRQVGEFRFYVRWRGSQCSRVRLVASSIDEDTGLPTGSVDENDKHGLRFAEIVRQLAGGPLGQAQVIRRAAEVLSVAGELWVAILQRPQPGGGTKEEWFAVTREEFKSGSRNDSVLIVLPDGSTHEYVKGRDGLFRVWNPDPQRAAEPDSVANGVKEPMREIVRATKRIGNADLSRLISAGLLMVPSEASLPPATGPTAGGSTAGGDEASPRPGVAQSLQEKIVQVAEIAVKDEQSLAALVPIVAAAPGDQLQNIKHIEFGSEITKVALETRNDAIARLAMGLDMTPEQLLGLGKNTNHWSAHMMADQEVQVHLGPVMQTICSAFYDSVLRNVLVDEGIDPDRYTLWWDASALTADPDLTDEAKDAYAGGAIHADALVRAYGLPEDSVYDLDSIEGLKVFARDAVTKNPQLIGMYAPLLDGARGIEFPQPAALPQGDDTGDADELVDPGDEPDTDEDGGGYAIAASAGAADMLITERLNRAFDLAGKRRLNTHDPELRSRLRGFEPREYHRVLPAVRADQVPGLVRGWDSGLDEVAARFGVDAAKVRDEVLRRVRRELTSEVVDGQVS